MIGAVSSIEELEAQFKAAQAASEAYSAEVTEKYKREIPPEVDEKTGKELPVTPELSLQRARAWSDAEREHLAGLRAAATQAAVLLSRARQQAEGHTAGD